MSYQFTARLFSVGLALIALPSAANAVQTLTVIYSADAGGFINSYRFTDTGNFRITIAGANGGANYGGAGASLTADFALTAGTQFDILIGARGAGTGFNAGGGGGGTFITVNSRVFFVAGGGGGGGGGSLGDANSGQFGLSGSDGVGTGPSGGVKGGGKGGQSGQGGKASVSGGGRGGGGFFTGGSPSGGASYSSVIASGRGDVATLTTGGQAAGNDGGGGGGGYSGGGGGYAGALSSQRFGGGGGGSFLGSGTLITEFLNGSASGTGNVLIQQITETSAVPEPAAWAMMITGFGIVGTAARRRRGVPLTT